MTILPAKLGATDDEGSGIIGPQGPQGPEGTIGPQGLQGVKGDTGSQGLQGIQGTKGDQGIAGTQGTQGLKGETGDTGPQGPQGLKGDKGDKGDAGATGATGLVWKGLFDNTTTYDTNDAVSFGGATYFAVAPSTGVNPGTDDTYWSVLAARGAKGDKGDKGDAGPQGLQGAKGATGSQGLQGIQGVAGETGAKGTQGIQGTPGAQGLKGDTGPQGLRGIQGVQGVAGPQGAKGDKGATGATGPSGASLYSYYRYTNIANGPADILLPGTDNTYFRVLQETSGTFNYYLVSSGGPNRYVDFQYLAIPGIGASTQNAVTTGGKNNTVTASSVIGIVNAAYNGLRKIEFLIKEWGVGRIYEINCYHHGRADAANKPLLIEIRWFTY